MSAERNSALSESCQHVSLDMLRTTQQENLCMRLALDLLACGAARFDRSGPARSPDQLIEFVFQGFCYSRRLGDPWAPVITYIGIAKCEAAIPRQKF